MCSLEAFEKNVFDINVNSSLKFMVKFAFDVNVNERLLFILKLCLGPIRLRTLRGKHQHFNKFQVITLDSQI